MKIDSRLLFCNCLGIFQGGGVKAIAYAGAYDEAKKAGISFSHVAGTSAGAIFAALIAAGASPEKILEIAQSKEIKEIPSPHYPEKCHNYVVLIMTTFMLLLGLWFIAKGHSWFWPFFCIALLFVIYSEYIIKSWHIYKSCRDHYGYHDSNKIALTVDRWLHEIMNKGESEIITFKDLSFELTVFSCDVSKKEVHRWSKETTGNAKVADAVAASCSIPFYFSPMKMSEDYHVDGGLLINRPNRIHNTLPNYYQALSFKLKSKEGAIKSFWDYVNAMVNTVVEGPETLGFIERKTEQPIYGHDGVNDVDILIENISATSFDKLTKEAVDCLIEAGREGLRKFIGETNIKLDSHGSDCFSVSSNRTLDEIDYVYNQVAFWSYNENERILVSDINLDWVWPLFPTLISWVNKKTNIVVKYSSEIKGDTSTDRFDAQCRLLHSLGIQPESVPDKDMIRGFFFKKGNDCKCILLSGGFDSQNKLIAKVYNSGIDSVFVAKIMEALCSSLPPSQKGQILLHRIDNDEYINILKSVGAYSDKGEKPDIVFSKVKIRDLRFVKREIRSLKFKELRIIDSLYKEADIDKYNPAYLELIDGKKSYMTPIVVEKHRDELVVIKGNARCFKIYSDEDSMATVPVFIIKNPPSLNREKTFGIEELYLSEKKNRGAAKLSPNRQIDQAFRPDKKYLKE